MLAATQLGLVPSEVKKPQDEAFSIVKLSRSAWPTTQREYKSEDVRRIATALNRSINGMIDAIVNALDDSLVDERSDITDQAELDLAELQKFQRALALPVEQSRQGATVDLPEFRSAIPAIMDRVVRIWAGMNSVHDVFMSWISLGQAEGITQGYRDVLDVVKSMPEAKSITFPSRHRAKIAMGVAAVAVAGGAAWFFLRVNRSLALQEPELLPAEEPSIPVGIHIFGQEPDIPSVEDRIITTRSGEEILISGDVENKSTMSRVADLIAKTQ